VDTKSNFSDRMRPRFRVDGGHFDFGMGGLNGAHGRLHGKHIVSVSEAE
jgi:hypothetical protein